MTGNPSSDVAGGTVVAEALMVTNPLYRFALAAFVALGVGVVAWGLFGSLPNRIQGFGEIVTREGLHGVSSPATGPVEHVYARYGDRVAKGDLLLRLKQPDLADQVAATNIQVQALKSELDILRSGDKQSASLRRQLQALERKRLDAQLAEAQAQVAFLESQLAKEEKLFKKGIIISATVADTKDTLARSKVDRDQAREQIQSLNLDNQQWLTQTDMNEKVKANQLVNLRKQLDDLNRQYRRSTEVRAGHAGRVIEVNVAAGTLAQRGETLLVLEEDGAANSYQFDLYVPYSADNRITPGMRVDIELLTVDHDLYGWLVGEVGEINEYVSTDAELRDNLQNDALESKIEMNGPVFRATVKLHRDAATASGFAWTDHKGPPFRVNVGSLGKAYVHVEDKAPIDYLIPIFKKYFD